MINFNIFFNRRKQWIEVYLHDVTPYKFERSGGGRWGYYDSYVERSIRSGKFGEIHLVSNRVRHDSVAHELGHALFDIVLSKGGSFSRQSEERIAILLDELTRGFWREYEKLDLN